MSLHIWLLRARALFAKKRVEEELSEELEVHLEMQARKHEAEGMPREDALRRARLELGGLEKTKEECREHRGIAPVEILLRDCRYALRTFRRAPALALTVVLTMAVTIGANTTLFSFCKAILLDTLPVPSPRELHLVLMERPGMHQDYFSFLDLRDMRQAANGIATLTGFTETVELPLKENDDETRTIQGQLVAGNFFSVLGVKPFHGRGFSAADNQAGSPPVALISYRFWQRQFRGADNIIGRQIVINRAPVVVIGVLPRSFNGVEAGTRPDLWMPLAVQSRIGYTGFASMNAIDPAKPWFLQDVVWLHVLGRSAGDPKGVRLQAALERMARVQIADVLQKVTDPKERDLLLHTHILLRSGALGLPRLQDQFSSPLGALFVLSGILLFCGCINLSSLLLARARAQQHEIALRLSLGGSWGRLVAQLLTETMLLTSVGGLLSLPLAYAGERMATAWLRMGQQFFFLQVEIDWDVYLFALLLAAACGIVIALLPAFRYLRFDQPGVLGQRAQAALQTESGWKISSLLTMGQMAISVVSLVLAALLAHTLLNYARLDIGVDRANVLSVMLNPSAAGYDNAAKLNALYHAITAAIDGIPGVTSSAVSGCGLMNGCLGTLDIEIPGSAKPVGGGGLEVQRNYVGPHYLSCVGIRLLRGREITRRDTAGAPLIAVVNRTFEKKLLHGENALGRVILMEGQRITIEGVAADARANDIHKQPLPLMYLPIVQAPGGWNISRVEVRTAIAPRAVEQQIRAAIASINPAIPVSEIVPLSEEVDRDLSRELLVARLAGVFSILTLLIAALGLYGVLTFEVTRRRSEIGIRMALGANRQWVLRGIARQALLILGGGCAAGLLLSFFASRLVSSLIFGIGRLDIPSYGASLGALFAVSLLAALVPAWRAAGIDPASALRLN